MLVVVHSFIYGKNFFDNPDKVYTDLNEFKTVNDYEEFSNFLTAMNDQFPFEPDEELSANKKILLCKAEFDSELSHINAKGFEGRTDMFSNHNVIRVTEELYNEYR